MGDITEGAVCDRLDRIVDPCSAAKGTDLSVVELGLIESIEIDDGDVTVRMRLTSPGCKMIPYFHQEIDERVGTLPGVTSVKLETDSGFEWAPDMMTEEARRAREQRRAELEERYRSEIDGTVRDDETAKLDRSERPPTATQ
jgi:metal-sulfur cluster biosynthetic enzyme